MSYSSLHLAHRNARPVPCILYRTTHLNLIEMQLLAISLIALVALVRYVLLFHFVLAARVCPACFRRLVVNEHGSRSLQFAETRMDFEHETSRC